MSKQMRDCFRPFESTWFDWEDSRARRSDQFPRPRIFESLRLYKWSFQRHRSSFAHELPLRSDVKQSADNFFGRFRRYPLHGRQRSATCPVEATVRGWPEMVGREEGGPPVRRPLRSGRAIKVFAHEEVEPEEQGERRACKKEKSRGRRKGKIMPTFARRTRRWMSRGSMVDRCDWGPLKLAISRTSC